MRVRAPWPARGGCPATTSGTLPTGTSYISVTVADADRVDFVDRDLVRFAERDIPVCGFRTVQTQSADGLGMEHTVPELVEHRAAPARISAVRGRLSGAPRHAARGRARRARGGGRNGSDAAAAVHFTAVFLDSASPLGHPVGS